MTLGERCDEIVRLIEETLCDVGASPSDTTGDASSVSTGEFAPLRTRALAQSA